MRVCYPFQYYFSTIGSDNIHCPTLDNYSENIPLLTKEGP